MTSNYFQQYIGGYTVANFWRYPIRRCVTNSCALEYWLSLWVLPDIKPQKDKPIRLSTGYSHGTATKSFLWRFRKAKTTLNFGLTEYESNKLYMYLPNTLRMAQNTIFVIIWEQQVEETWYYRTGKVWKSHEIQKIEQVWNVTDLK